MIKFKLSKWETEWKINKHCLDMTWYKLFKSRGTYFLMLSYVGVCVWMLVCFSTSPIWKQNWYLMYIITTCFSKNYLVHNMLFLIRYLCTIVNKYWISWRSFFFFFCVITHKNFFKLLLCTLFIKSKLIYMSGHHT